MVKAHLRSIFIILSALSPTLGQQLNICTPLIRQYEAAHGIPYNLLTAISMVESGRKIRGAVVPWPWTINADGKPYVFANKTEAIQMVHKLRRSGITSIDVGCMQINLKHHPEAFSNLDAAFDPATNIAYAAKFLRAQKLMTGSWSGAVAHYHSTTPKFHIPYKAKVFKTWAKVQNYGFNFPELNDSTDFSIMSLLDGHQGNFVKSISTPSGRRVPLMVQFAPYKGISSRSKRVSLQTLPSQGQGRAPVLLIDGQLKKVGKVIVNKFRTANYQQGSVDNDRGFGKVIRIATPQKICSPRQKVRVLSPSQKLTSRSRFGN